MIESIEFKNFKVLRNAILPLGRCTVLVGPNGSGKTTVLQALEALSEKRKFKFRQVVTAGLPQDAQTTVEVRANLAPPHAGVTQIIRWTSDGNVSVGRDDNAGGHDTSMIRAMSIYSLDANALASPVTPERNATLASNGAGLAGVLDRIRDQQPERFEALNAEFARWVTEFDRILLDFVTDRQRAVFLRSREGHFRISAPNVSQGVLLSLALLTLTYLPEPPSVVALEEPDRGIHPRLLRRVQDALYRLAYPESCGETREPVQVIVTTHSPFFLDLFREHPEDVVIANRVGNDVRFERLSDQPHIEEILGSAPLGEAWYTGILGGVPSEP